jgi:hypothetical protein
MPLLLEQLLHVSRGGAMAAVAKVRKSQRTRLALTEAEVLL